MIEYVNEYLGTMILIFIIFSTDNWIAIGATLGFCKLFGGGLYNPASAFAHNYANRLNDCDLLIYIIVEILGAITAFIIYSQFFLNDAN